MRKFGLIGYPLHISFAPSYFKNKYEKLAVKDATYELFPMKDIADVIEVIKNENLVGFNVTVPHKTSILPYLDEISEEAKQIGAVNTVKVVQGKLIGYNTDHIGFRKSLKGIRPKGVVAALIFGTGGSSKAVKYALQQLGILYSSVSRGNDAEYTYASLSQEDIEEHDILINTTPLGMEPKVDECVDIQYDSIGETHLVYDLVYHPEESVFLQKSKKRGAKIKNGLQMLELQADEAWDIWNT